MAKRPPVPGSLGTDGEALWKEIAWKYPLRADELKILQDACFAADVQNKLAADITVQPLKSQGSQGQEVINPSYTEWRMYGGLVRDHLLKLRLPDSPTAPGAGNRQQADISKKRQAAVRERWSKPAANK